MILAYSEAARDDLAEIIDFLKQQIAPRLERCKKDFKKALQWIKSAARGQVHDGERMRQARGRGAGIDLIAHGQLMDAAQTLARRRVDQLRFEIVKLDESLKAIADFVRDFGHDYSCPQLPFGHAPWRNSCFADDCDHAGEAKQQFGRRGFPKTPRHSEGSFIISFRRPNASCLARP